MKNVKKEAFKVVGIKVRTTNENGQAGHDIPALWNRFITENIWEKIPNKVDPSILSIYTNYESDHTKPYDTILGCQVSTLDEIPEGMIGQAFESGKYATFLAEGDLDQGVIYQTWTEIWNSELDREFKADFEVHDITMKDRKNATVEIFVGVV